MKYSEILPKMILNKKYLWKFRNFYLLIRSIPYKGNNYICPCCNNHFRRFLPESTGKRLNVQCPRCKSLERHRILWMYLKEKTNILSKNIKILHIAPEFCFQVKFRSMSNIEYYPADLNSPYAKIEMDITNIQYPINFFDVILCNHVLEHIPNDTKAMSELFRVLKPDGWAIIDVPINYNSEKTFEDPKIITPKDRKQFYGHSDHVRLYGKDFIDRLKESGFKVKAEKFTDSLDKKIIDKHILPRYKTIYFCTKY